jgi:hypothetical protein
MPAASNTLVAQANLLRVKADQTARLSGCSVLRQMVDEHAQQSRRPS